MIFFELNSEENEFLRLSPSPLQLVSLSPYKSVYLSWKKWYFLTQTQKETKKTSTKLRIPSIEKKRQLESVHARENIPKLKGEKKKESAFVWTAHSDGYFVQTYTHTHNTRTESQLKYQKKKQKYHNMFYFVNYSSEGRIKKQ